NQVTYGPVGVTVDNRPPAPPATDATAGGPPAAAASLPSFPAPDPQLAGPGPELASAAPNGANASARARFAAAGATRTGRHGTAPVLRGRLVDPGGQPIAGARRDVVARVRTPGARAKVVAHATTDAAGRYVYRLAAGPSRDVTFAYRAKAADAG